MAIASNSPSIYRVICKPNYRGILPVAKMQEVVSAMNADTSGQFQYVYGLGNILMFDWAPNQATNPSSSALLGRFIEWGGIAFTAISLMRTKGA